MQATLLKMCILLEVQVISELTSRFEFLLCTRGAKIKGVCGYLKTCKGKNPKKGDELL